MNTNQNYGIALHILGYLAYKEDYVSSKNLSNSINTNPVVVRRILGVLSKQGIIETKRGHFGSRLNKKPEDISFYDVYKLFNEGIISGPKHEPNQHCPVGMIINDVVTNVLIKNTIEYESSLKNYNIKDVLMELDEKRG